LGRIVDNKRCDDSADLVGTRVWSYRGQKKEPYKNESRALDDLHTSDTTTGQRRTCNATY